MKKTTKIFILELAIIVLIFFIPVATEFILYH